MLKIVNHPNEPDICTAVTSFMSGILMIFHVFVERLELIHMTDLTGSWSVNLDVGATGMKWLGVQMLAKKVMLGSCTRMMSHFFLGMLLMRSRWALGDLLRLICRIRNLLAFDEFVSLIG
jgi:hypothetical protein